MENNCKATPASELKPKKKPRLNFKFRTNFSLRDCEEPRDWFSFYPKRSYFKFQVESYGYFDPRPIVSSNITSLIILVVLVYSLFSFSVSAIHLILLPFLFFGWGDFYLKLPFDTGKGQEAETPAYGFYMYHVDPVPKKLNMPTCFIWQWNNYKSWDMPWAYTHIRHSILLKNGNWEHDYKGDRKCFYEDRWEEHKYMIEYDFLDKSDNTIIPTKVYVEEREWRQHWLTWTKLFSKVSKCIDVKFSKEVGSRKGSWKGGVVGCGYKMKHGETALECVKRMESERKFR